MHYTKSWITGFMVLAGHNTGRSYLPTGNWPGMLLPPPVVTEGRWYLTLIIQRKFRNGCRIFCSIYLRVVDCFQFRDATDFTVTFSTLPNDWVYFRKRIRKAVFEPTILRWEKPNARNICCLVSISHSW